MMPNKKDTYLVCKLLTIVLAVVVSGFLTVSKAFAASYYVSNTGVDTNDGSLYLPWKTINKAVSTINAGDVIYVRGGTYNEAVKIGTSGGSSAVKTLSNYPGETVVINGGTSVALSATANIGYWDINGLTFKSTNRYTVMFGWWGSPVTNNLNIKNNKIYGPLLVKGSYILIEGNESDGTGYAGSDGDAGLMDIDGSHHNTFKNNNVHDYLNTDGRGIWTQGFTHDDLIEGNTVTNIATTSGIGQCIDLDGASTVEWRHVVINNKVKNCSYVGIQLENVFDSRIENNIIEDGKSAGIIVISYDSGVKCKVGGETNQYGDTNGDNSCKGDQTNDIIRGNIISNKSGGWGWGYGGVIIWGAGGVKIYSNTFYASSNDGNGAINVQDAASVTSGTVVKNNIIFPGTGAALCALDYASFSDDSYNLVYKTGDSNVYGIGSGCTKSYSLATYKSTFGKGQNSIQANPLFVAAASGDFHLQSTSPAIDKGTNVGSLTDIEGKSRPQGAEYDMGAYEFSGTPACTLVNGTWTYGAWGTCSVTCGGGTQTRTSTCTGASCGGTCTGVAITTQSCNATVCPTSSPPPPAPCTSVNGSWSYGAWGTCSVTCGGGTQTRTATCLGTSCGGTCTESALTSQVCNTQVCETPVTPPIVSAKPGDANGDNKVDETDYSIWLSNYQTSTTLKQKGGDFNGDGKVDGGDYIIWLTDFGK